MLQRIIAVVLLVAGFVAVGLGVASATVWRDSDTVVASTSFSGDGTLLVTDPGVLDLVDDDVTIRASAPGEEKVTLAIGRDVDVEGWVGDDPHGVVTGLADWDALATEQSAAPADDATGDPSAEPSTDTSDEPADDETPAADDADSGDKTPAADDADTDAADTDDAPTTGVDPAGSDMWLAEATGEGSATLRWSDQPGRWQLIAAGVGEGASAPTLELTWPREVTTPWLWPGVIGGVVLILLGLLVGAAALRSGRRKSSGRRGGTGTTGTLPVVATAGTSTAGEDTPPGEGAASGSDGDSAAEDQPGRALTRRELREREEAERLAEQEQRAQKPRRAWLTGQIPLVSKDRRPKTAAQPVVEPLAAAESPQQDTTTTRADTWRRTWGFSPVTGGAAGSGPDDGQADGPAGATSADADDEKKDDTP